MLNTYLNSRYQQFLVNPLATYIANKLSPNQLTMIAAATGIAVLPSLLYGHCLLATLLLLISGYCDSLDGTVARITQQTSDFGTLLDVTCDRLVEFLVIFALFALDPSHRGGFALIMLGSILLCVTSFLMVGLFTPNASSKSFFYSPGLMERAEAFIFFILMIWFPAYFAYLALSFSILTVLTACIRIKQFGALRVGFIK